MTCYELEEDLTGMLRSIHSMEKMLCQVLNGKRDVDLLDQTTI